MNTLYFLIVKIDQLKSDDMPKFFDFISEGISGIIINLEKIMSNFYYVQQPTILKQSSQILTPLTFQQSNYTIVRGNLTDRAHQDLKTGLPITAATLNNQSQLSRQGSFKNLHENGRPLQPTVIQTRSSCGIQNQRTFSDYQISPAVKVQDQQLPLGGGYNISSKIGQKVKNKTELHKSNSKATLNSSELNKTPSIRYVESIIEADRGELAKLENVIEIINAEIGKIHEKFNLHEEKIDKLQKNNKRNEDFNENGFTTRQMEEINKILSVVERSQQRDDYKKTIKMIEQLRQTILELNSQVKTLEESCSLLKTKQNDVNVQHLKKQLLQSVAQKSNQMKQISEYQIKQLIKKIGEIQQHWKQSRKEQQTNLSITSSVKKFQGKMITLLYQQKITHSQATNPHTLTIGVTKGVSSFSEKENNSPVVLTTKTYYIDSNGYLLDRNKYYLLNHRNEQIKLSDKQIDLLKKHNIL